MRDVTLVQIFDHPITQKYVKRSGMAHAIACAYHAFKLAKEYDVNPDLAAKAAFYMILVIILGIETENGIIHYIKKMIFMRSKEQSEHINLLIRLR